MRRSTILDTGPLVAFIKRQDDYHDWAKATLQTSQYPFITCEAVITEACFLLSKVYKGEEAVMPLLNDDVIQVNFQMADYTVALSKLMIQYESLPMSLADACLVKMAELNPDSSVMTLDSDFKIYRMHRNKTIPVVMPDNF